jgi:histidinol-phosphatase (PHP family)
MMLPADSHVHTEWSWDTGATPGLMERMCAQATELGLPAVAFTDHLDLMAWEVDPSDLAGLDHLKAFLTPEGALALPPVDIGQYLECVDRCRDKFPDLRIITGMELGQPHRTGKAAAELPGFGQLERVLGPCTCYRLVTSSLSRRAYIGCGRPRTSWDSIWPRCPA